MPAAAVERRPVDDCEIATLLSPLQGFAKLALAVSGGGDSMALLHAYARWREISAKAPPAVVLSVDHGLRTEAAGEVALVAMRCRALEIPHHTLFWRGPKPASGLQQAAREARYRLMRETMTHESADVLVLAHTQDDQAETFLERLARGSGVYGLAAMRERTVRDGVVLARPFLDVSRERLRATLETAGVAWADDPSNQDVRYTRVRMRKLLGELAPHGLGSSRLAATARSMARAAEALDIWVQTVLTRDVGRHPSGPARFDARLLARLPDEVAFRLMALLVRDIGGNAHVPRLARLETALAALAVGDARRTLGGCVLQRKGGTVVIHRESGRDGMPTLEIAPGETRVWDGRFVLALSADAAGPVSVTALGRGGLSRAGLSSPAGWPRSVFTTAPLVCWRGKMLTVPGFDVPVPAHWRGQVSVQRIEA